MLNVGLDKDGGGVERLRSGDCDVVGLVWLVAGI